MKHDARSDRDSASNDMEHDDVDDVQEDVEEEVGGGGLISRSTLRHLISSLVGASPAVAVEAASPQQPPLEPSTEAGGPGGPGGGGGGGGDDGDGGSSVGVGSGVGGGVSGGDADANDDEDTPRVRAGCVLWDLSARAEYAELLIELGLMAAVGKVLSSDDADADLRYAEVVLGLLGNMATHASVRPAFCDNQSGRAALCSALGTFLSCTDSAVLREGCRLLAMLCRDIRDEHDPDGGDGGGDAALCDQGAGTTWLVGLLATEGFASKVLFILHNTLDVDLLGQAWYMTYMSCYASARLWRALDGASSSSSLLSMDQAFLTSLDTRTHMLQDLMHTTVGGRTGLEYCLRALEVHISRRNSAHEHAAPQASVPAQSPSSIPIDAAATRTSDAPVPPLQEAAVVIDHHHQQQQQQRLLAALEWLLMRSYTDHQDTTHDTAAHPPTHPPPTPPQPGWDVDTPVSSRSTTIHAAGAAGGMDVSRPTPASMDTPHLLLLSSAAVVVADLVDLLVQPSPSSQQQQHRQAPERGAEASNPILAAVPTQQATFFVIPSGGVPQADKGSAQALLDASVTLVQQCAVRVRDSAHTPSDAAPVRCVQTTSTLLEALCSFASLVLVCVENQRYTGVLHKSSEADKVRLLGRINSLAEQLETSLRSEKRSPVADGGSVDRDKYHSDKRHRPLVMEEEGWRELIRPIVAAVRVLDKWMSESD